MLNQKVPVKFPEIIGAVITHLPDQKDYHGVRMRVVQTCLTSMRKHAGRRLPIFIWDNGSCKELINWLLNEFKPEWLMISPNLGKSNARAAVMRILPGESVVCMSDDDMLYYPGWLDPQLDILNTYPNVGIVSGWPVRRSMGINNGNTIKWAETYAKITKGRFITDQEEGDYATSIGNKPISIHEMFLNQMDIMAEYQGIKAYCTSQHCQFIARVKTVAPFCVESEEAMATERPFDKSIDDAHLLRLTTVKRVTRHIGNIVDDKINIELKAMGL
jgi:hypothetical protein